MGQYSLLLEGEALSMHEMTTTIHNPLYELPESEKVIPQGQSQQIALPF